MINNRESSMFFVCRYFIGKYCWVLMGILLINIIVEVFFYFDFLGIKFKKYDIFV